MEFLRTKKRGRTQITYREWRDETDQYRIVWRSEAFGVKVIPGYYATVRCVRSPSDDFEYWDFCGKRGPYKVMNKAVEAAEKHKRLWDQFFKIVDGPYKGRADRIRALNIKATIGKGERAHRVMMSLPSSVRWSADSTALRILFPQGRKLTELEEDEWQPSPNEITPSPDQPDHSETWRTSETDSHKETSLRKGSSRKPRLNGPASAATAGDGPTTSRARRSSTTADASSIASNVLSATAPAAEVEKPVKRRTTKRSGSGKSDAVSSMT